MLIAILMVRLVTCVIVVACSVSCNLLSIVFMQILCYNINYKYAYKFFIQLQAFNTAITFEEGLRWFEEDVTRRCLLLAFS